MASSEQVLKKKAVFGVILLSVKRVVLQLIFTSSNIFLARLLFPDDFGTFAIVGSVVVFFSVFSDLGLAISLIQRKGVVKAVDIQTAFSLQLFLGILLVVLIFLTADIVSNFFNLGFVGMSLLKIYSLKFLIDPFRQVPQAILERNLDYKKIVLIDVLTTLVGSGSIVFLAFLGFGVYSFVYGQIISHVTSALLLFVFLRWPVGVNFDRRVFLNLAHFGIPFQSQMILGLFYGPLILLYLGKQVGQENLGYWQFAASISASSMAVSDIINRIVFPLAARVQQDKTFLREIIERSMSIVSATSLPLVSVMLVAIAPIIHFVYTDKWLPVLPALYLGIVQMGVIAYTGIFGQILLALGKSKVMRNIGFFWAILTWLVAPILIERFNFVGMSLTGLLVSASGIWLFFRLQRAVKFSFWTNFYPYFVLSILAAATFLMASQVFKGTFGGLVFALCAAGAAYLILILILRRGLIFSTLKLVVSVFGRK